MYTPPYFSVDDPDTIRTFVEAHGFGILISAGEESIDDTHTAMYFSDDMKYVYGHIARANRQWKSWSDSPKVKAIFHGPHTYISPNDYVSEFNVPTWNYTAVSIDGSIEVLDEAENKYSD